MPRNESPQERGISLIEIIVTLAILSIAGTLAAPGFAKLRQSTERTTVLNDFIHAVYFAHSEAHKRKSVVSICRSNDGVNCDNKAADWNGGWIVFENLNHDQPADTDPGEPILLRHEPIKGATFTSNRVSFSFRAYGQGDVNGTLVYCPSMGAKEARAIIVSHTGRPRTSNKDAGGQPLKC